MLLFSNPWLYFFPRTKAVDLIRHLLQRNHHIISVRPWGKHVFNLSSQKQQLEVVFNKGRPWLNLINYRLSRRIPYSVLIHLAALDVYFHLPGSLQSMFYLSCKCIRGAQVQHTQPSGSLVCRWPPRSTCAWKWTPTFGKGVNPVYSARQENIQQLLWEFLFRLPPRYTNWQITKGKSLLGQR